MKPIFHIEIHKDNIYILRDKLNILSNIAYRITMKSGAYAIMYHILGTQDLEFVPDDDEYYSCIREDDDIDTLEGAKYHLLKRFRQEYVCRSRKGMVERFQRLVKAYHLVKDIEAVLPYVSPDDVTFYDRMPARGVVYSNPQFTPLENEVLSLVIDRYSVFAYPAEPEVDYLCNLYFHIAKSPRMLEFLDNIELFAYDKLIKPNMTIIRNLNSEYIVSIAHPIFTQYPYMKKEKGPIITPIPSIPWDPALLIPDQLTIRLIGPRELTVTHIMYHMEYKDHLRHGSGEFVSINEHPHVPPSDIRPDIHTALIEYNWTVGNVGFRDAFAKAARWKQYYPVDNPPAKSEKDLVNHVYACMGILPVEYQLPLCELSYDALDHAINFVDIFWEKQELKHASHN